MKHLLHSIIVVLIISMPIANCMNTHDAEHQSTQISTTYDSDWEKDWNRPLEAVLKSFDSFSNTPALSQSPSPSIASKDPLNKIRKHFEIDVEALKKDYCALSVSDQREADILLATLSRKHLDNEKLLNFLRHYNIINTQNEEGRTLLSHAIQDLVVSIDNKEAEYKQTSAMLRRGAHPLKKDESSQICPLEQLTQHITQSPEHSPEMKAWMLSVTASLLLLQASRQSMGL